MSQWHKYGMDTMFQINKQYCNDIQYHDMVNYKVTSLHPAQYSMYVYKCLSGTNSKYTTKIHLGIPPKSI